jgi:cytoskeleton protein RodZ
MAVNPIETACMSKVAFGERLKRERELRGISRDEVCSATRIGSRFLDALENERWEDLPGGIFNRGFIRAVARFLGLDEDDLVAEYDLAIQEQHLENREPATLPPPPAQATKPRLRRLAILGALSALFLIVATWIGWKWYHAAFLQTANKYPVIAALPPSRQSGPPPASTPDPASPANSSVAPPGSVENKAEGLELKIEAGKETTVSILADGSKVFEGSMIAGQSRTFTAQNAIDISAKDAGALLLELNGQTLAPLGPPGQPGNATLTRGDLKPAGGGAN